MFYQLTTDHRARQVDLHNFCGAPFRSPCWIIGGGPSLTQLPLSTIANSPAPKFMINLAGSGHLRPNFWTSYDPTARFHRSIYCDPSVVKFVHRCRATDIVPETTYKVAECPSVFFFDRQKDIGYADFLSSRTNITDWQDSLVQAIDIAYRLGFRDIYLAGTEMFITPSQRWLAIAQQNGVSYRTGELLNDFANRCEKAGMSRQLLEKLSTDSQYHFAENKPLAAAIQTDFHYFRVAQYLRLARRAIADAGLSITSVTPVSRLNDFFPQCDVPEAVNRIHDTIGNPASEQTAGRYTDSENRLPPLFCNMRDFRPHFWKDESQQPDHQQRKKERLRQALDHGPEVAVPIEEQG